MAIMELIVTAFIFLGLLSIGVAVALSAISAVIAAIGGLFMLLNKLFSTTAPYDK